MPLTPGERIGGYEIIDALGAGGMGEVYRARDTRLARTVAVKILPEREAVDADRIARFEREARTLASLNHPHIAQIYGVEDRAIVMELVEGDDLSHRIQRGALPVDEALAVARQIADALDAAHSAGIIHRDLKPANIKVRPDGTVKVLDFGLAKGAESSVPGGLATSPTFTSPVMTQAGIILGTAGYMSPEQARGKAVDKRADIWAFGCVLYEMLTGRPAFEGETVTDILGAIVKSEADLAALPDTTPATVRSLIARCLQKDAARRLRDVGDAIPDLVAAPTLPMSPSAAPVLTSRVLLAASLAGAVAIGAAIAWLLKPAPTIDTPTIRASLALPEPVGAGQIAQVTLAIARDGRAIAVATESAAFIRHLDHLAFVRLPQTDGARGVFFSPDGQWVGYWTARRIGRVSADGANHMVMHESPSILALSGAHWGADDVIYFSAPMGLYSLPAAGGAPRQVMQATAMSAASVVPSLGVMFYSRMSPGGIAASASSDVIVRDLANGAETTLTDGNTPQYVQGRVFFVRGTTLLSAPFDRRARAFAAEPLQVTEGVARIGVVGQFAVSDTGTLVFLPGNSVLQPLGLLRRVQRNGTGHVVSDVERQYSDPRVSPRGDRVALHLSEQDDDVWVQDLARGVQTRITFDGREDETPVWSPDGTWLAYSGFERNGSNRAIFRRKVDGSGDEEVLWTAVSHTHVTDWLADGTLLIEAIDPERSSDVMTLRVDDAERTLRPLLATRYAEHSARVSPDGRWMAYASNESGRLEVYVQAYPALGYKQQVSTAGGMQPVWSRDGRELFFRADKHLMTARVVASGAELTISAPAVVMNDTFGRPQGETHTTYDVLPDGEFLFIEALERERTGAVTMVFNLFRELR
jgi:eukaryotic-like serine/threonine-protein kinase